MADLDYLKCMSDCFASFWSYVVTHQIQPPQITIFLQSSWYFIYIMLNMS